MPKEYSRTQRVADQIQRELAQLIQQELKDPRLGMITVTAVSVSREFEHAKVYVTMLDGDRKGALKVLHKAAGFLRRELAHRMKLRSTPQLHFVYDASIEHGTRLTGLIDAAVAQEQSETD